MSFLQIDINIFEALLFSNSVCEFFGSSVFSRSGSNEIAESVCKILNARF